MHTKSWYYQKVGQTSVYYRLKAGDSVNVEVGDPYPPWNRSNYTFNSHPIFFHFFVVAKARRNHRCNVCGGGIGKGQRYFGCHDIKRNWPKLCPSCAIRAFENHTLEEFVSSYTPDSCYPDLLKEEEIVLREVDMKELLEELCAARKKKEADYSG